MTSALLLVCRLTGCLTGCVWRGTRSIHLHYQRHWTVLPTINELPQRSDLSKQEIRLNFYCYCTFFVFLREEEKRTLWPNPVKPLNCGRFARKSIRPTAFARKLVDSPEDIQHCTTWWTYLPRCLVTLGFHTCGHCLSMLIPFFRLKERQIRFGRIDLGWSNCYRANRLSGKTTWYQTIGFIYLFFTEIRT